MPGAADPFTWELYLCAHSNVDADGFLLGQPDYWGNQGGDGVEVSPPYGFYGRALDPEKDAAGNVVKGTPMLVAWEGGKGLGIYLTDARSVAKLPTIGKGESVQYGPNANYVRCDAAGGITLSTTRDGTRTGQTISQSITTTGRTFFSPWGKEVFDPTGYHLFCRSGGARLDLGGIGGLPAPLSSFGSYAKLQASSIELRGSLVALGPTGGVFEPAAKSTALLAALDTIGFLAQALAVPGALLSSPTGGPVTMTPELAAAITDVLAALTAAHATIPSQSTTVT